MTAESITREFGLDMAVQLALHKYLDILAGKMPPVVVVHM